MKSFRHTAVFALLAFLPRAAQACDQCMGAKDSHIRPAVNGAIFFMLGLVAAMAGTIGFLMHNLSKRAALPMEPHQELVQLMTMNPPDHA